MDTLQQLVTLALLGSERSVQGAPGQVAPKTAGELGSLIEDISNQTTTTGLQILRTAGVLALARSAGFQPATTTISIEAPSFRESAPLPKALLDSLPDLFRDSPLRLQLDALKAFIHANATLPAGIQPLLFDLGRKQPVLQASLKAVAGESGRWLAGLNTEWAYLLEDPELDQNLWDNGSREQRLDFFIHLRARDADKARELLSTQLGDMDARERSGLVDALRTGLTTNDEVLLETLLRDRSKEVRSSAASLLGTLPGSRYVQQMMERVQACIHSERKLLRTAIKLEPPEVFDPAWKADAIEENRPANEPLGQRAWWLLQLTRNLPLAWWETQLALSPADLLKWAAGTDWNLALLRAWYAGVMREANSQWASAFLQHKLPKDFFWNPFELIGSLPVTGRESFWLAQWNNGHKQMARGLLLNRIVTGIGLEGDSPSPAFVRQLLSTIKQELPEDHSKWDYELRASIVEFACVIPAELLDEAGEGWPMDNPATQFFSETLSRLLRVIQQRKLLFLLSTT